MMMKFLMHGVQTFKIPVIYEDDLLYTLDQVNIQLWIKSVTIQ